MTESQDPTDATVEMVPLLDEEERNKIPVWAWWLFGAAAIVLIVLVWLAISNSTDDENAPIAEPTATASASPSPEPSDSPTPMPSPTDVPSEEPSDSPTPMPSPTGIPSEEPSDTPTPMPSPTDVPTVPTSFDEGKVVVGKDAAAGTYRTDAPVAVGKCVWLLQGTASGDPAHNLTPAALSGGVPTVTFADGDTFASRGCGSWSQVDPGSLFDNNKAPIKIKPGVWLVGEDVAPGNYQSESLDSTANPLRACRWTVSESLDSNFTDVIIRDSLLSGIGTVSLEVGQQIESTNCGTWASLAK